MKNTVIAQYVLNALALIIFIVCLYIDNPQHRTIGNIIGWIFLIGCWVMMYINYKNK